MLCLFLLRFGYGVVELWSVPAAGSGRHHHTAPSKAWTENWLASRGWIQCYRCRARALTVFASYRILPWVCCPPFFARDAALASAPHLDSTPTARPCFELKPGRRSERLGYAGKSEVWKRRNSYSFVHFFESSLVFREMARKWCRGWGLFFFHLFCSFRRGVSGVGVFGERAIDSEPSYFDGTRRDIIVFVLGLSDGQTGRTVKI